MKNILLEVRDLKKYYSTPRGMLHAVDGVSFSIPEGSTLGVVGESGCGKTTTGRAILRLVEPTSGEIKFNGQDVVAMNKGELRQLRQEMQIIFQDPFSSLDPRKTVEQIIGEPIQVNNLIKGNQEINRRVLELMDMVGLSDRFIYSYPHELDGGRRQRVGIARALSLNPKLIVCDEPVSALDVSIQAQILNLLKDLQDNLSLTYLFITHNLSVVNYFSDVIAVMYLGVIVEHAPVQKLFDNPIHPYTRALLSAIPIPDLKPKPKRIPLMGEIPSPINMPNRCRFEPRCAYATEACKGASPDLIEVETGHYVACHLKDSLP